MRNSHSASIFLALIDPTAGFFLAGVGDKELLDRRCELRHFKKKLRKMLKKAGFVEIKVQPKDKSRELIQAWDPNKSDNAGDYVVSAYIEAVKPI